MKQGCSSFVGATDDSDGVARRASTCDAVELVERRVGRIQATSSNERPKSSPCNELR